MRKRVGIPYTIAIAGRLTPRDWAILDSLYRCRLATGKQLGRLHFAVPVPVSRRTRSDVLRRLVGLRLIRVADRPIGGLPGGERSTVYRLDTAGDLLVRLRRDPKNTRPRRRPGLPGDRFVAHVLTVTELYVQAVEAERGQRFALRDFQAEPACWWTTSDGTTLKPDAYLRVGNGEISDAWWLEADLGTESIPAVKTKLARYARFAANDGRGPGGVRPAVLITTPGTPRAEAIRTRALPATNDPDLFCVVALRDAIDAIATTLNN